MKKERVNYYTTEQEFCNGLETRLDLMVSNNPGGAYAMRSFWFDGITFQWTNDYDVVDDAQARTITRLSKPSDSYRYCVFEEKKAVHAIMDAVDFNGSPGTLDYVGDEVKKIDVTELELPVDAYPWTGWFHKDRYCGVENKPGQYRPYKIVKRPYDMENPDEEMVYDVYMNMRTDNGEFTYVESLDCVGTMILANIFLHLE